MVLLLGGCATSMSAWDTGSCAQRGGIVEKKCTFWYSNGLCQTYNDICVGGITHAEYEKQQQQSANKWATAKNAEDRWINIEIEQAKLDEQDSSPKYPELAWLNGIWCNTAYPYNPVRRRSAHRFQVIDRSKLKYATFYPATTIQDVPNPKPASIIEDIRHIRMNGGTVEMYSVKNPNKDQFYHILAVKKINKNQYRKVIGEYVSAGEQPEPLKFKSIFKRCTNVN